MQRGPNGDFDVQLKTTADEGVTAADNGLVEAELREVFGGKDSGFVLEEKLGQGSFGVVFKASSSDGIEMAIKFVRTDDPVAVAKDLAINNEMLRVFGDTPYEPLFSLPQGVLKIKRTGREDQLALIFDKME